MKLHIGPPGTAFTFIQFHGRPGLAGPMLESRRDLGGERGGRREGPSGAQTSVGKLIGHRKTKSNGGRSPAQARDFPHPFTLCFVPGIHI